MTIERIKRVSFDVTNKEELKTGDTLERIDATRRYYEADKETETELIDTLINLNSELLLAETENPLAGEALFNIIKDASPSTLEMLKELNTQGLVLTVKEPTKDK